MKGRRYTDQQILEILGQVDAGQPLAELTRLHGVAVSTIHRWKARYGGRPRTKPNGFVFWRRKTADSRSGWPTSRQPGAEGGGLKKMVDPDATPQSQTPLKRQVVGFVRRRSLVTERRASRQLGLWCSTQRHNSPGAGNDEALKTRLRVLALERPRLVMLQI